MTHFPTVDARCRPSTECVDYIHFPFDLMDLHATWRKATIDARAKNSVSDLDKRREYMVWRRFFQKKNKIKECNPQMKIWLRNMGYTDHSIYGPFLANGEVPPSKFERSSSEDIRTSSDNVKKPALKIKIRARDLTIKIVSNTELRKCTSDTALNSLTVPMVKTHPSLCCKSSTPKEVVCKFFEEEISKNSSSCNCTTPKTLRFSPTKEFGPTAHYGPHEAADTTQRCQPPTIKVEKVEDDFDFSLEEIGFVASDYLIPARTKEKPIPVLISESYKMHTSISANRNFSEYIEERRLDVARIERENRELLEQEEAEMLLQLTKERERIIYEEVQKLTRIAESSGPFGAHHHAYGLPVDISRIMESKEPNPTVKDVFSLGWEDGSVRPKYVSEDTPGDLIDYVLEKIQNSLEIVAVVSTIINWFAS